MLVQILWHCPYPWDVRIEKVIEVCFELSFSVGLICRGQGELAEVEDRGRLCIRRVGSAAGRLARFWSYPLFFNPVWWKKASRVIYETSPSALIVRDIPLAMTAIWLGAKFKIPVILDMAENYPAALVAYENRAYKPFLIGGAYLPKAYERSVVHKVNHILVVAEEQIERLGKLGVPQEKITIIRNTPDLRSFANSSSKTQLPESKLKKNYPSILYIGKIDRHRGLEVMIRALPDVLEHYPKARLVLVGDGKEKSSLQTLVQTLGLAENVTFTGWVNHKFLPTYIYASTICCIPHLKSEHTDTTIPNKLFDYMALGKPVVTSSLSPVKRIVENTGCGKSFESGSSKDLAKVLLSVANSPKVDEMGQKGMSAVMSEFNWRVDAKKLKNLLVRILSSGTRGGKVSD